MASRMAVQGLVSRVADVEAGSGDRSTDERRRAWLEHAVRSLNAEIHQAGVDSGLAGMGTPLTAGMLVGSTLHLAHVGDSRAYLVRKGRLRQLTADHTWVAEATASGALRSEEAGEHPFRHVLTRALGIAHDVEVDVRSTRLLEGDALVLCSDGLYNLVSDGRIAQVATHYAPQQASRMLTDEANDRGGHDNITVVVVRMLARRDRQAAL